MIELMPDFGSSKAALIQYNIFRVAGYLPVESSPTSRQQLYILRRLSNPPQARLVIHYMIFTEYLAKVPIHAAKLWLAVSSVCWNRSINGKFSWLAISIIGSFFWEIIYVSTQVFHSGIVMSSQSVEVLGVITHTCLDCRR